MSRQTLGVDERRRRRHRTLIYVILATLPCYFCGIVLLVGFSGGAGQGRATDDLAGTITETTTADATLTNTPGGPTLTLMFTPTQWQTPTERPTDVLSPTPDLDATATVRVLLTQNASSLTATVLASTQFAQATGTAQAQATATFNAIATATQAANQTLAANRPPNAADDSATTQQGEPVTINVLANDSDPDGDVLSISAFDATSREGGAVECGGGACRYTPPGGFSGPDRFSYTASDGRGGTDSATVSIDVRARPNRPPDAVDDEATTTRNTPVEINVLANDSDPDGDPIRLIDVENISLEDGEVECANGICTYTPPPDFTGEDRFQYTITDGRGANDTASVRIRVNAP